MKNDSLITRRYKIPNFFAFFILIIIIKNGIKLIVMPGIMSNM